MPQLSGEDLTIMLRRYAPYTDPDRAAAVVTRFANPYALQLYLTLDSTRESISDGKLHVSDEELQTLPFAIRELYELRWLELPPSIRTALIYAVAALPSTNLTLHYDNRIIATIARQAGLIEDEGSVVAALTQASSEYAWAARSSSRFYRIRESILAEIIDSHISSAKRREYRAGRTSSSSRLDQRHARRYVHA
jgi:hypothetical protein